MNGKRIKIVFILMILISLILLIFIDHTPDFDLIYTENNTLIKENSPYWICIKDEKFNGFFSEEYLKQYNVDFDEWDLDNHTYIVSFGYKIKKIEYSYYKYRHNHGSIRPLGYLPRVTVEGEKDNTIYIYELDKINLESLFPDGSDEMIFE